jgi:hypothetical protein
MKGHLSRLEARWVNNIADENDQIGYEFTTARTTNSPSAMSTETP